MNWQRTFGLLLIGAGLVVLTLKLSAGFDSAAALEKAAGRWNPKVAATLQHPMVKQYGTYGLAGVPIVLGAIFLAIGLRKEKKPAQPEAASTTSVAAKKVRTSNAPVHACNVLRTGAGEPRLWHFESRSSGLVLNREFKLGGSDGLPKTVEKDWHNLFQRKLNVAWLHPEHVFLRVIQLPVSDYTETLSMVEFQLEKLSPMPVAQVVWSMHILPEVQNNLQTIVVLVVGRNAVEEFLGRLEGQGFMADRLELPVLDELQAPQLSADGAWIHPIAEASKPAALVAWRQDGILQNVDLLSLPETNRGAAVRDQLMQMAWAGEMEGWLKSQPIWRVVADGGPDAEWTAAIKEGLGEQVEVVPPISDAELAAMTATRAVKADPRANLLPIEFSTRYQQEFVDRLWMRGLFGIVVLYLIGIGIYFVALGFASYRTKAVEQQVADLGPTYTNAIQLKARMEVLQDRQELKFAALDCWNTTATLLPENVTLETLNFSDGRKLTLTGTAPTDLVQRLTDFEGDMRKAKDAGGQPLFDPNKGDNMNYRSNPGNQTVTWNLMLELRRVEVQ